MLVSSIKLFNIFGLEFIIYLNSWLISVSVGNVPGFVLKKLFNAILSICINISTCDWLNLLIWLISNPSKFPISDNAKPSCLINSSSSISSIGIVGFSTFDTDGNSGSCSTSSG